MEENELSDNDRKELELFRQFIALCDEYRKVNGVTLPNPLPLWVIQGLYSKVYNNVG